MNTPGQLHFGYFKVPISLRQAHSTTRNHEEISRLPYAVLNKLKFGQKHK